ncbi:MAG: DUF3987 domain-containing protein, partial [Hymenobacter sp.]
WKDVSPYVSEINLTDHFKQLSYKVYNMVKFLQMGDTIITLSKEQWQQLNTQCSIWLQDITTFTGEDAASIVKRLGLVLYRIAMLLTTLRKYEHGEASETAECSDVDFNTAFQLVEIYLQHSILMFNNLPRQQENNNFQGGILMVSHDVTMLQAVCTSLWVCDQGTVEHFGGTVKDYKKRITAQAGADGVAVQHN